MHYTTTDRTHPIKVIVDFEECPDCTSTTCYEEIAADDYHDHINYRCVNCDAVIRQEF